jgi:RNA polymerase sigma factor (TIGR02999 family)
MNEVTRLLSAIDQGDPQAADRLLPLVYAELRRQAAALLAREKPGQTLQATALVHEAYLRLVGEQHFANRLHFFAAAAEAMRHILVDAARRKHARKRGAGTKRLALDPDLLAAPADDADVWIDLDEALTTLAEVDAAAARLAKLRVFGGLSAEEAGEALGLSRAGAFRAWTYARAYLTAALADRPENP